jgi:hypothetical protein
VSLAGVVGASLFLNFPAFALGVTNSSGSTVISKQVLAQSNSGSQTSPTNTPGSQPTAPGGSNSGGTGSGGSNSGGTGSGGSTQENATPPTAPDANNAGVKPGPAPTNRQPGSWICINNPSEECRR